MPRKTAQSGTPNQVWRLPFDYEAACATGFQGTETDAYIQLGCYLEQIGHLEDALIALRRATELSPDDARTYYYLGKVLVRAKRLEEAVSTLERSLALAPDHWVTALNLGKVLAELRDDQRAATVLSRAVALNRRAGSALIHRAQSYIRLGRPMEAMADIEAARRLDPRSKKLQRLAEEFHRSLYGDHPPD
jgi:tetratricopeptide (TPR) repeat protein